MCREDEKVDWDALDSYGDDSAPSCLICNNMKRQPDTRVECMHAKKYAVTVVTLCYDVDALVSPSLENPKNNKALTIISEAVRSARPCG